MSTDAEYVCNICNTLTTLKKCAQHNKTQKHQDALRPDDPEVIKRKIRQADAAKKKLGIHND
jgi:hypothetical protein